MTTRKALPAAQAKAPFEVKRVMALLRKAVAPYPKAALFQLASEGFDSTFEQLVACIISIRTRDEVTAPTARRLFQTARTPQALAQLSAAQIDALIRPCTFHEAKASQLQAIAEEVVSEHGGQLPCDWSTLVALRGVGPKCASLVLGIACDQPQIGVDVHVHRIVNRWGYVQTRTPEQTMLALRKQLPRRYWIKLNSLLVPFGKHVCTGQLPRCSDCPVEVMCRQVGVDKHR